jgi:hypothetical protein
VKNEHVPNNGWLLRLHHSQPCHCVLNVTQFLASSDLCDPASALLALFGTGRLALPEVEIVPERKAFQRHTMYCNRATEMGFIAGFQRAFNDLYKRSQRSVELVGGDYIESL